MRREVESSTRIQLKTLPRWLINEDRLREQQDDGKQGSAIVITVRGETEAKHLCASGLRFGGVTRVVERYWEAGPSSVCMTCCGIGHERMGNCGDRPSQCTICAGAHKVENHRCGVVGCTKGVGKVCVHVMLKCANCGENHAANSPRCSSRHKADIKARKENITREKKGKEIAEREEEEREQSAQPDTEMELEGERWAQSPETELSWDSAEPEAQDHTQNY